MNPVKVPLGKLLNPKLLLKETKQGRNRMYKVFTEILR